MNANHIRRVGAVYCGKLCYDVAQERNQRPTPERQQDQPTPTPSEVASTALKVAVTSGLMTVTSGFESWDDVLEQARGSTVNLYLWGGPQPSMSS